MNCIFDITVRILQDLPQNSPPQNIDPLFPVVMPTDVNSKNEDPTSNDVNPIRELPSQTDVRTDDEFSVQSADVFFTPVSQTVSLSWSLLQHRLVTQVEIEAAVSSIMVIANCCCAVA